jgi:hypothetical protein
MTTENLVPSRETCTALKEAGFPQGDVEHGAFMWVRYNERWMLRTNGVYMGADERIAAPTLHELLEWLRARGATPLVATYLGLQLWHVETVSGTLTTTEHGNPAEAAAQVALKVLKEAKGDD